MALNQILIGAIVVLVLGTISANVYVMGQAVPPANGCRAATFKVIL